MPNLDRERKMFFEQVARRLIDIEELESTLPTDREPYEASSQSRFNNPEIIAVLGDIVRRLRLLQGTRAAVGRAGFSLDLQQLASATLDDLMEALKIAKPGDSMSTACARREMPTKVKTALRTVLLSCSDVPGTEGRKTQLRFNGHGNNLFFGSPSFFMTPNFADTYSPLVLLLHKGPGKDSHLSTPQLYDNITRAQPSMPSLEQMHQIVAADPRAQAKFGILMTELHYRYIIGVERLHIGRTTLARPHLPVHDEVAASLQPCIAPGTVDVQAPFEAQGRGFFHGHGKGHSIIGPTIKWLRKAMATGLAGLADAARRLRERVLSMATTVQYEAANEPGTTCQQNRSQQGNNARAEWTEERTKMAVFGNMPPSRLQWSSPTSRRNATEQLQRIGPQCLALLRTRTCRLQGRFKQHSHGIGSGRASAVPVKLLKLLALMAKHPRHLSAATGAYTK